jgi:putative (di)nucleoside polyphosphate hydrolase
VPLEDVIEFKRAVYESALNELAPHLHQKAVHQKIK